MEDFKYFLNHVKQEYTNGSTWAFFIQNFLLWFIRGLGFSIAIALIYVLII